MKKKCIRIKEIEWLMAGNICAKHQTKWKEKKKSEKREEHNRI